MAQDNMYLQRKMMAALEQTPPLHQFLHKTFFNRTVRHTTRFIEYDVRKGKREIARFVNPLHAAHTVGKDGFETKTTMPAYTKEKMQVTPLETQFRVFGDNAYVPKTPQQVADEMMGENLRTLNERLSRLEEKLCADALFTGKVIAEGLGWSTNVDFDYSAGTEYTDNIFTLTGTSAWNNPNSSPLKDIDRWRRNIVRRCGIRPTHLICAYDVGWAFIEHPEIQKYLDNRRYEIGTVQPDLQANGVSFISEFSLPSGRIQVYVYDEWFIDPVDGAEKPIVPAGKVLIGSNQARCEFHYGMIQNMESLQAVPRWVKVWTELDGSANWVQLESAPMPNLFQPDAFIVGNVLA